jgi:hypothetical protein
MRSSFRSFVWLAASCLALSGTALAQSSSSGGIAQESLAPPKSQAPRVSSGLMVPAGSAAPSLPPVPKTDQAAAAAARASAPAAPVATPVATPSPSASASASAAPPSLLGRSQPGQADVPTSGATAARPHIVHAAHAPKPAKATTIAKAKPKSAKPSKVAKTKPKTQTTQQG